MAPDTADTARAAVAATTLDGDCWTREAAAVMADEGTMATVPPVVTRGRANDTVTLLNAPVVVLVFGVDILETAAVK